MTSSTVLIISTEPLIGALLGALVELEGHRPVFHEGGEPPQASVDRNEPDAILVDIGHPDGASDDFLQRQREAGTPVILYSPKQDREDVKNLAERWDLAWIPMPVVPTHFARTLARALAA